MHTIALLSCNTFINLPTILPTCLHIHLPVSLQIAVYVIISSRLHEILGNGEFGTVYRGLVSQRIQNSGEDCRDEVVAVKFLEDSNNEEAKVKFLQEAAIMAQFNHPNIIRILGIVVDDQVCRSLKTSVLSMIIRMY